MHCVSIPPWFDFALDVVRRVCEKHAGFNPTLVRFCRFSVWRKQGLILCFNPTLVRFCPRSGAGKCCSDDGFQSHLGSILPSREVSNHASALDVSIPPWFDFAQAEVFVAEFVVAVSIPPWFDFAASAQNNPAGPSCVSIPPWFDFAVAGENRRAFYQRISIPPWFDFAMLIT